MSENGDRYKTLLVLSVTMQYIYHILFVGMVRGNKMIMRFVDWYGESVLAPIMMRLGAFFICAGAIVELVLVTCFLAVVFAVVAGCGYGLLKLVGWL